ncbi:MAG: hypothetical protein AB1921_18330 [Thermodesulfobacteriota bacterium]
MLIVAAVLLFGIGLAHSVLGERYILIRLFKRDNLPRLLGGDSFTKGTLRFAWHLTTLAWWGFAVLLVEVSSRAPNLPGLVLWVAACVFFLSGVLSAGFTRGKHLSWVVFFAVAILCAARGLLG